MPDESIKKYFELKQLDLYDELSKTSVKFAAGDISATEYLELNSKTNADLDLITDAIRILREDKHNKIK